MRHRFLPLLALLSLLLPLPATAAPTVSTVADQTGIALTIYNQNLGLVKDRREIRLAPGNGELRFMDVAAQIIPTSVSIASLSSGELRVLEQNYEYDLLSPQKLMDKYVGKEVKLHQKNPYTEREEVVTATLLSNNGGPVYRIGDEITFGHPGRLIFPGVPDDLIARPTLVWLLEGAAVEKRTIEASYLTGGISWRADYVVTLSEKDDRASLAGWVTIDNRSGAAYRNATLKLVAGDVNRVQEQPTRFAKSVRAEAMAPAPQFQEEAFFEYHLYTLQRPSTIKENQTKQINLVTADAVPVKKEFLLKGESFYYYSPASEAVKQKVGVFVEMENRKEHNLGMPLPKGVVRVYKRDAGGSLQFVGEDTIDHTPEKETVRVKLGDAFDVVGERKQTEWKKVASDTYEAAFEIKLRNHKKEDITVKVVEPVPGDWQMLSSSHPHEKGDAFSAVFKVSVPKDGETTLVYRVRMRY
ncbi:DUF4139 domain-containing protein [Geobacter hydrogenophilus]|uniref:DUF4139 domain-containing protein n=1 Tax=Geobacter hydrogenophilus TaxID=40983 RepID=A0A9W6FZS8_9BACT|nr:DUF4139 domain-containing protein [Geobacter hydrogenophilus]MBT0893906.1 DUF4139 domain-containing protein [Geobacter hydrogenophilus]GLI38149.1 DUF4139 domain-containing protein [Geobacter hydrogenophilus]